MSDRPACNRQPPACQQEIDAASELVTAATAYAADVRAGLLNRRQKHLRCSELIQKIYACDHQASLSVLRGVREYDGE